jgi:hypothetical protein
MESHRHDHKDRIVSPESDAERDAERDAHEQLAARAERDAAQARAEQLAAHMRSLGIDPDESTGG